MKSFKHLLLLCAVLTVIASCKEIESKFSIKWEQSDKYTVETVTEAAPGEEIPVKVTAKSDEVVITSVKFNSQQATLVSSEGNVSDWSFVMPNCDVKLEVTAQENPYFPITWNECESYTIETVSKAKASENVTVTVTAASGVEIKGLKFNDSDCKLESSEADKYVYSFTMPAEAVALTVDYNAPAKVYSITAEDRSGMYSFSVAKSAEEGSLVKFTMTFVNQAYKVLNVSLGAGLSCEPKGETSDDEVTVYDFEFTMPSRDVTLEPSVDKNWHRIYRVSGEHSEVKALNCIVKDEQGNPVPDEDGSWICQQVKGEMFHFIVYPELGYDVEITVKGESGKGYGYGPATAPDFGNCLGVVMPNEAITVESFTSEKDDYKGEPFVGDYKGYFIDLSKASAIVSSEEANAQIALKANTVFTVKTSDANAFDFKGTYTYDKSNNSFRYNHADCDAYGLSGTTGNDFNLFIVNNKVEDKPEHTRFYVVSTDESSDYVCASNASMNDALIQVKTQSGENAFYLFKRSSYSLTAVDVRFEQGNSIAQEGAVAFFTDQAAGVSYKYSVKGGNAVFEIGGKEAGEYAPAEGEQADLILDGFGGGSYKGEDGTYTADGTLVDFTVNSGAKTSFILDFSTRTYTTVAGEGEWNGPVEFFVEGEFGTHYDKVRNATIRIKLNKEESKANFIIMIGGDYNILENAVNDYVGYVYDAQAGTITLSQCLVGTSGWDSKREDFVFAVSEDKSKLTFTGVDIIYALSTFKRYVTVTDLEVPAL